MAKVKQLTAWVESKPGELGRIAEALGKAKVNISAFTCWSAGSESPVHLLVSSPAKAKKVLQELGVRVTEEEVLRVTLPDKPGALGERGCSPGGGEHQHRVRLRQRPSRRQERRTLSYRFRTWWELPRS